MGGYFWYVSREDDVIPPAIASVPPNRAHAGEHPAVAMSAVVVFPIRFAPIHQAWIVLRGLRGERHQTGARIQEFVKVQPPPTNARVSCGSQGPADDGDGQVLRRNCRRWNKFSSVNSTR